MKQTNNKKKKKNVKKKKGFTLIELLAVIIILGILMIIAIPSVTKYISDSRKNAYVDTAKEVIGSTRNLVNSGELGMYDTNTTYYIPVSAIKTENDLKSPYGDFEEAYVAVTYDGTGYKYYFVGVDDAGQGVGTITPGDDLDTDDIKSDLTPSNIEDTVKTTGVGNRQNILILDNNGNWSGQYNANNKISEDGGVIVYPVGKTESTVAIGDIVTIGTEDFYVFENNNSELKLLARYNLKVGKDYDNSGHVTHEHTSSEEGYGIQSSDMYGLSEDESHRTGAVMFSTTNYWVGQTGEGQKYSSRYVYDSNSIIYPYLESYKTYLEGFGVNPEVKLLNEDDLGTTIDTKYGFLFTTTFWSGSSISRNGSEYIGIFYYSSNYNTGMASPQSFASFGVRPLVIIQK